MNSQRYRKIRDIKKEEETITRNRKIALIILCLVLVFISCSCVPYLHSSGGTRLSYSDMSYTLQELPIISKCPPQHLLYKRVSSDEWYYYCRGELYPNAYNHNYYYYPNNYEYNYDYRYGNRGWIRRDRSNGNEEIEQDSLRVRELNERYRGLEEE